jgi:DNA-directed RNA polymerase specialized sigma24 family protein
MATPEVLAVARLRQWAYERIAIHHGHTASIEQPRFSQRKSISFDARIVRVITFEQVFAALDLVGQILLAAVYRDGQRVEDAAKLAGVSLRAATYKLPAARRQLAELLDREDLL